VEDAIEALGKTLATGAAFSKNFPCETARQQKNVVAVEKNENSSYVRSWRRIDGPSGLDKVKKQESARAGLKDRSAADSLKERGPSRRKASSSRKPTCLIVGLWHAVVPKHRPAAGGPHAMPTGVASTCSRMFAGRVGRRHRTKKTQAAATSAENGIGRPC